jgi:hypothetical protein
VPVARSTPSSALSHLWGSIKEPRGLVLTKDLRVSFNNHFYTSRLRRGIQQNIITRQLEAVSEILIYLSHSRRPAPGPASGSLSFGAAKVPINKTTCNSRNVLGGFSQRCLPGAILSKQYRLAWTHLVLEYEVDRELKHLLTLTLQTPLNLRQVQLCTI